MVDNHQNINSGIEEIGDTKGVEALPNVYHQSKKGLAFLQYPLLRIQKGQRVI